jgi:HK97 family phage major capsid protein
MNLKRLITISTLLMLAMVSLLALTGAMPLAAALSCGIVIQLAAFLVAAPSAKLYITALTDEQVKEFSNILNSFKDYGDLFKELKELASVEGGLKSIKGLPALLKSEQQRAATLETEVSKLRKRAMAISQNGVRWVGDKPFVTDECALAFAGMYLACAARQDKWHKHFGDQDQVLGRAAEWVGVEKAALASTDIPLPTIYVPQVVELVYKYGQFRQYATVFPLGAGTVNLPQLKTGEDAFTFLGVGTAGMSQTVSERKVAAQNVTFTANKCGGIIRIPTEIEEDTFIPLGQFLARYIARRFANLEDATGFLGDGSATYANIKGVGPYTATVSTSQLVAMASGKTKPSDATIANFRKLRTVVNAAVLQNGNGCYYLHPSMDALLVGFNTLNNPLIYQRQNGSMPATLDGFPIRWVGVMQAYQETAAASAYLAFFGDLSYWYLGERGSARVETSREVYFATDEIGMRALERIDVEAMAPDAMASLQTAAS